MACGRGVEVARKLQKNPEVKFRVLCFAWSGKRDSNPRLSAWEADTLPTELLPLVECFYL